MREALPVSDNGLVLISCQYEKTFCRESLANVKHFLIFAQLDFSEIFSALVCNICYKKLQLGNDQEMIRKIIPLHKPRVEKLK